MDKELNKSGEKCFNEGCSCNYGKLYMVDFKVEELREVIIRSWILPLDIKGELYMNIERKLEDIIKEVTEARENYFNKS